MRLSSRISSPSYYPWTSLNDLKTLFIPSQNIQTDSTRGQLFEWGIGYVAPEFNGGLANIPYLKIQIKLPIGNKRPPPNIYMYETALTPGIMKIRNAVIFAAATITGLIGGCDCNSTPMASSATGGVSPVATATPGGASVASILLSNNSSYALSMKMDAGTYVAIAAAATYTFNSPANGTHVFTLAGLSGVHVYFANLSSCSAPGTPVSNTTSSLSTGNQYSINVVAGNQCGTPGIAYGLP
jgi:hypothetical protein